MNQSREQAVIAATETLTKVSGSATAVTATGTYGFWELLLSHQQPILMTCTFIGVVMTIFSYHMNRKYQCLRNDREQAQESREQEKHLEEMAVLKYKKEQLSNQRRESDPT